MVGVVGSGPCSQWTLDESPVPLSGLLFPVPAQLCSGRPIHDIHLIIHLPPP